GERPTRVLARFLDAEPLQQVSKLSSAAGGDPCDRVRGRRPASAGHAHVLAGDRVQQGRLPNPRASDERKHVRAAREAQPRRRGSSLVRALAISSAIAPSPKIASRSFWLRNAVPAAMPTSAPVRPAVYAKTPSITATATTFTPSAAICATARLRPACARTSSMIERIQALRPSRMAGPHPADADHRAGLRATSSAAWDRSDHATAVRLAASVA